MAPQIVYLHGIGDGDPTATWLDGLNAGLRGAGYDPVEASETLAPQYSTLLSTDGITAKMPPVTYRIRNDLDARLAYARRQARIERTIGLPKTTSGIGFDKVPEAPLAGAQSLGVDHIDLYDLPQVKRYVRDEGTRGAVLQYLLGQPFAEEIILIGHSLGSVIAIDLLDNLPEGIHVRRFVTIGSPANAPTLHKNSERLLKKFPYTYVDDWTNIVNPRDAVTGGRGLASTFPAAQDFIADIGPLEHGAGTYLSQPQVAALVGELHQPGKTLAHASTDIAGRLTDPQALTLLMFHFGHAVARHIKDDSAAQRYAEALTMLQDRWAAAEEELAAREARPLPEEFRQLAEGKLPPVPQRWELDDVVRELAVLALANPVEPYEIEVKQAPARAVPELAVELGFSSEIGSTVVAATEDVQGALGKREGVPWGRVLTGAAGVALLAAGPVGLMVAAPATAAGGAAIVGSLAAFGPGGMVGGLATLGGLAGAGGAAVSRAAGDSADTPGAALDLSTLILRVTIEHARRKLDLAVDPGLWTSLVDAEIKANSLVTEFSAFSDKKTPKLSAFEQVRDAIVRLMDFALDNGLTPPAVAASAGTENATSQTTDSSGPRRLSAIRNRITGPDQ